MNIRDNKGVNLISLTITIIVLLIITGAMIFNTKNQLANQEISSLKTDIETLNARVDEYYLTYGELPILCEYTNKRSFFEEKIYRIANDESNAAILNNQINDNDGDEYAVIDLEKLGGITLHYGYDKNGQYFDVKTQNGVTQKDVGDSIIIPDEDQIYVINTTTHQIYFPHGIFFDNIMYYRD